MIALYILLAILIFGVLIFVHELGHFLTARLFHVKIHEFSIGMGPKIVSIKSKKSETAYSWRLFPIGGFVSMEGEDEESNDENALQHKKVWQRIIITAAGAFMNLLTGFIIMLLLVSFHHVGTTTVVDFQDDAKSQESGLMIGDEIIAIDGHLVHTYYDMNYKITRYAVKPVTLTVLRNGVKTELNDVVFPATTEQGVSFGLPDYYVGLAKKNVGIVLKNAFFQSCTMVRMVYDSLYDLISGKYGMEAISGPVGITEVISDTAQTAVETKNASSFWLLVVLLAVNLGVVNLLPLPALDGGRIVFLIIEGIRRKPVNPKIEGYIHTAGMALLFLLMIVITFKDIFTLFR